MALEDYASSEVGIAVAATALVLSPKVRGWIRRGAVLGLAGALKAGDAVSDAARGMASEVQQGTASTVAEAKNTAKETPAPKTPARGAKAGPNTVAE